MKTLSRRWTATLVLSLLCATVLVAQVPDSAYVIFTSIGMASPLTSVGGVLHADDCDSVRIVSLVFTWHDHHPPYQVQPLDWSAGHGQNVPVNVPLPPTAPGFPEDVHVVYILYPDGTQHTLDVDSLVAGRSYALSPGCPPVPIQLSSFIGRVVRNRVQLDWTTLSEVNNYGFFVQKLRVGETEWNRVPNSFIAGHGTTTIPHHYTFTDPALMTASLRYRLEQIDLDGTVHHTEPIHIAAPTGVEEPTLREFSLLQNHPNPFNPTTTIKYQIPKTNHLTLKVFDILGREVATLVNEVKQPGIYNVQWDASGVASGVYLYRLSAGAFVETKKAVVLK